MFVQTFSRPTHTQVRPTSVLPPWHGFRALLQRFTTAVNRALHNTNFHLAAETKQRRLQKKKESIFEFKSICHLQNFCYLFCTKVRTIGLWAQKKVMQSGSYKFAEIKCGMNNNNNNNTVVQNRRPDIYGPCTKTFHLNELDCPHLGVCPKFPNSQVCIVLAKSPPL